mgnify:CR=1 FL=1
MNQIAIHILSLVQGLLLVTTGLATIYILVFAVSGLFYKQPPYPVAARFRKIAVLIPGYKEDEVIVEVARQALGQSYPANCFDVVIIADSFKPETLSRLREMPVKVIEVSFEKSTKAKALNKAMEQLGDDYDIAVVLDADNVMAIDFLVKVNKASKRNTKRYKVIVRPKT